MSPITIDDSPRPDKRFLYIPDMIPYGISVVSENSVSIFTTPYDSPKLPVITSYYPHPRNAMNIDNHIHGRVKI